MSQCHNLAGMAEYSVVYRTLQASHSWQNQWVGRVTVTVANQFFNSQLWQTQVWRAFPTNPLHSFVHHTRTSHTEPWVTWVLHCVILTLHWSTKGSLPRWANDWKKLLCKWQIFRDISIFLTQISLLSPLNSQTGVVWRRGKDGQRDQSFKFQLHFGCKRCRDYSRLTMYLTGSRVLLWVPGQGINFWHPETKVVTSEGDEILGFCFFRIRLLDSTRCPPRRSRCWWCSSLRLDPGSLQFKSK